MGYAYMKRFSLPSYPLTPEVYTQLRSEAARALETKDNRSMRAFFPTDEAGKTAQTLFKEDMGGQIDHTGKPSVTLTGTLTGIAKGPITPLAPANRDHQPILAYYRTLVGSDIIRDLGKADPKHGTLSGNLDADASLRMVALLAKGGASNQPLPQYVALKASQAMSTQIAKLPDLARLLPQIAKSLPSKSIEHPIVKKAYWFENDKHPGFKQLSHAVDQLEKANMEAENPSASVTRLGLFARQRGIVDAGMPAPLFGMVMTSLKTLGQVQKTGDIPRQDGVMAQMHALGQQLGKIEAQDSASQKSKGQAMDQSEVPVSKTVNALMLNMAKHYISRGQEDFAQSIERARKSFKNGLANPLSKGDVGSGDVGGSSQGGSVALPVLRPASWTRARWAGNKTQAEALESQVMALTYSAKLILNAVGPVENNKLPKPKNIHKKGPDKDGPSAPKI